MKTHFSRYEATALLGIPHSTFTYRIKRGVYGKGIKTGEALFAKRLFSLADLGMAPKPVPTPAEAPAPLPEPPSGHPEAPAPVLDESWAAKYKLGLVTDSFGNRFDGTNKQYPDAGLVSALGPMEPRAAEPFSCDAHMVEGMRAKIPTRDPRALDEHAEYVRQIATQRGNPLMLAFDYVRGNR